MIKPITDNTCKDPLILVTAACVFITVIVIGVLALLQYSPFATFAYSDVVAGCCFAFVSFSILCIAAVKGCLISPISNESAKQPEVVSLAKTSFAVYAKKSSK